LCCAAGQGYPAGSGTCSVVPDGVCWLGPGRLVNHVIILSEGHLKRILASYLEYYHGSRPHLSLDRNSPTPREVEPPWQGEVVSILQVGGLHHRYTRAA
jgi:hypothetical protein